MGCSNTKSTTAEDSKAPTAAAAATTAATPKCNKMEETAKQEYPASEAFVIPLDEQSAAPLQLNDTLREPPKRLQQLMQQAAETEPLTLEEVEDKLQRAEQRRQELMQQKIENIQKTAQMLMQPQGEQQEQDEQQT
ncbi:CG13578 [Drosophila busckii]|uniref:CG13578 n=1 Tax=Drosophila busckii TaxID=30019 RepID=A0A0M4EA41_DROBS|nr:uncharacterized protein LOC108595841 [Drosophila busckii]ALC41884.1 CG13578 [Drosophila busckii]